MDPNADCSRNADAYALAGEESYLWIISIDPRLSASGDKRRAGEGGRGGDINAHQYFSARFRSKSVRTQESRVNSGFETPFSKDVHKTERSSSTVKRTEDSQETADGADYLSVHVSAYVCFANTEI